ncbi:MAG TPA: hypothetical protein G4O04_03830 [Anaerolineae bacterium]|nr:hypothetical protein [Anaerolineae bacterium]HID83824.1 hypothetical protein [Anaerolineales bacterium]HIQ09061.1 hypothetical protein [Anaerolineaceae bacterium]
MARLPKGEKAWRLRKVYRLLQRHPFGLRESEIAEEMGWHRRTANNYLRELARQGKATKEGRLWFWKR